jgi:predicted nucleic acid-binding Zn ribbon protein
MIKNGCHDADKLYDRMRVDASLKLSQIMSVKFAPEPHLHAQSRTISSLTVNTQTKAESSKGTHQRDSAPSSPVRSILGTPLTESPISTNAPHRFVYICGQEAERQPLLPSSQAPAIVNKASRFWPIAFGVLVMLALALLVIIGGWRLGKGAGGGRWPGGPA